MFTMQDFTENIEVSSVITREKNAFLKDIRRNIAFIPSKNFVNYLNHNLKILENFKISNLPQFS